MIYEWSLIMWWKYYVSFICINLETVETQSPTAASTRYVPFKPIIKTSTATTSDPGLFSLYVSDIYLIQKKKERTHNMYKCMHNLYNS